MEIYRDLSAQRVFHAKLLQTEKLAALGRMVSGVAHELSNPLTSIAGYAHRLLARQDLPGRTEEVRQIYQEAERASTILRQLLLNAGETLPERRLVSLNQVVQRAMDLQRFSLAAEKIRVEIDLDPALPFVQGDPGHLQQVPMNLVGCLPATLGLVRSRLRQAQRVADSAHEPFEETPEDFGEVLRHELNNPLTGILGNAELLIAEVHRKNDGTFPHGEEHRLETIAALAVRLRETVRRLSQEWEARQNPVH